ncbi:hypothetical protein [Metabacillus malikii]|uniref:5-methylthioribose kinase n=1 Tax=Metabacillus malikii TaxID=1504265 RepID=A0ABT9ZBT7_9BACI|nr:hypothetical protein [Metabacillus malikii]MDQ0229470.1 5-methylthioribose kinase [Metabacillus malikii]
MTTKRKQNYSRLTETEVITLARRLQFFEENCQLSCVKIEENNIHIVFKLNDTISDTSIIVQQTYNKDHKKSAQFFFEQFPKIFYYDEVQGITVIENTPILHFV